MGVVRGVMNRMAKQSAENGRPGLDITGITFAPVIKLPKTYEIYDFTEGYDAGRHRESVYGIGRYNEHRPTMYDAPQYLTEDEPRTVHMGIDIAAPDGEPIFAFYGGQVYAIADNANPLDYGPTIVTEHHWLGQTVYALHGHLSRESLTKVAVGQRFSKGECLGAVGSMSENGGWNPHVHFQLSLRAPSTADMPGVVRLSEREQALKVYPDPRLVLGALY